MNSRTHIVDLSFTWDANKNKTSESITGVMSGYGVTAAGTTAGNEDLCFSSSLQPPDSILLIDIDANGTADVTFQYDALRRRVARTGTGGSVVFVQMDQQTIADYPVGGAATTPTFRYVYASYIDEPVVRKTAGTGGTLVYFHRNQQYSVTAITTSAGGISERYAYSAYGQPTILDASASVLSSSAINNRYTYTGREWDATLGLHHFRARWMSPSAGRFLARDPIGYEGSMWGLYEYAESSPSINNDYSGLACWFCTSIDSVTELKNEDGKIIGCALTYMFNDKVFQKSYNGGGPCPKDCSPVLSCQDLGDLDGKKFTKFIEPKYSGLPFLRKPYCPKKEDVDPEYCLGITAHKCNGHLPGDFKNCTDLCNRANAASIVCKGLPLGMKQLCQAFVRGSVANCIYYCENSMVEISEQDPGGRAK